MPFKRETKPGPALYYLSTPTRDHLPIFALSELANWTVPQLERAGMDHDAIIVGYCLLPANLRALVGFKGNHDPAGFMYDFKWLSSRAIFALEHGEFHDRLFRKGKFRPWMNRFDKMHIGTKEQMLSRLENIHNSPVISGLVEQPSRWQFSSAGDWIDGKPGMIEITKNVMWIE